MDSIKKHLKEKGFNLINVTASITDAASRKKHVQLMKKRPYVVSYMEKNTKNMDFFNPYVLDCPGDKINYIFYYKDKYFAVYMDDKNTEKMCQAIDSFLKPDVLVCKVCNKNSKDIDTCAECFHSVCYNCLRKIDIKNKELLCPNCQKPTFASVRNGSLAGVFNEEEAKKLGLKPGSRITLPDGKCVMALSEAQMRAYGLI